jgi:hypothetical protein
MTDARTGDKMREATCACGTTIVWPSRGGRTRTRCDACDDKVMRARKALANKRAYDRKTAVVAKAQRP